MKKLCILGCTGSIGCQTLDVVRLNKNGYTIDSLVAGANAELLIKQALEFIPNIVVIADEGKYNEVKQALSHTHIEIATGKQAVCDCASRSVDIVIGAITGAEGLAPVLSAIDAGNDIALANKESLVCAGDMVMDIARSKGVKILPVDSEHSALFQVYCAPQKDSLKKIVLTASGGSFLHETKEYIDKATVEQALNHPNWSMGKKVTIDSAGLMNKGLELIEACHLFNVEHDMVDVIVHPQSIIHSMISYQDGSTLAQMGYPDMRTPIAVAMAYPNRIDSGVECLDFATMGELTFQKPDEVRFPALNLCRNAFKSGGGACMVLNASNEIAVDAFLNQKISFGHIAKIVATALDTYSYKTPETLLEFEEMNMEIREKTKSFV